jgi:hypothetical protein
VSNISTHALVVTVLAVGGNRLSMLCLVVSQGAFFTAQWQEYHTGGFNHARFCLINCLPLPSLPNTHSHMSLFHSILPGVLQHAYNGFGVTEMLHLIELFAVAGGVFHGAIPTWSHAPLPAVAAEYVDAASAFLSHCLSVVHLDGVTLPRAATAGSAFTNGEAFVYIYSLSMFAGLVLVIVQNYFGFLQTHVSHSVPPQKITQNVAASRAALMEGQGGRAMVQFSSLLAVVVVAMLWPSHVYQRSIRLLCIVTGSLIVLITNRMIVCSMGKMPFQSLHTVILPYVGVWALFTVYPSSFTGETHTQALWLLLVFQVGSITFAFSTITYPAFATEHSLFLPCFCICYRTLTLSTLLLHLLPNPHSFYLAFAFATEPSLFIPCFCICYQTLTLFSFLSYLVFQVGSIAHVCFGQSFICLPCLC